LQGLVERLRRVRIENRDALILFKDFKNRPGTLVYFDPPYLGPRSQGYDFDQSSIVYHQKIMDEVVSAKCMIFISGYENETYNKCLVQSSGWTREVIRATTKGNNGKSFEREELIWFNEAFRNALESNRIPLRLSEKESHNRKVNPKRIAC